MKCIVCLTYYSTYFYGGVNMSIFKIIYGDLCVMLGIHKHCKLNYREHNHKYVPFRPIKRRLNYLKANKHRVLLVNNVYAKNPTYKELIQFLDNDKTEQIEYKYGRFVCADYAQVLHNHAEKAGLKAGWVSVDFTHGEGHACNVFKTVDKGLIFVDSVGNLDGSRNDDKVVKIHVGMEYKPEPVHPRNVFYYSMGTVKRYRIYW